MSPSPSPPERDSEKSGASRPADGLLPIVYDQLRELAGRAFRRQGNALTLQPTAVVHEVYLRMAGSKEEDFHSRTHFLAVASKAMRQVLLNHHRDRSALKRGGNLERVTLSGCDPALTGGSLDFLALNEALEELSELDERQCTIVELRFFSGLTVPEIAAALDVSKTTVESEWRHARAWLKVRLEDSPEDRERN